MRSHLVGLMVCAMASHAHAQDRTFAEEPTGGLHLPAVPLAGDHDAFSVVTNPAGLRFVNGFHLGIGLDGVDEDEVTTAGPGAGVYLASSTSGGLLPKLGYGMSLEFLRPTRVRLDPDPGEPTRLSSSVALPVGTSAAIGVVWHHFFDSDGRTLSGLDTFDVGLSFRAGSRWGAGFVIRDVGEPTVAGVPVQRRYELEIASRPIETDRLELGLGGRVGEIRGDVDGWLRVGVKVARGVYVRAQFETIELHEIASGIATTEADDSREYRITTGLVLSFGGLGVGTYGTAAFDDEGDGRLHGGSLTVRLSSEQIPSLLPRPKRIERLELRGGVGSRGLTGVVAYLRNLAKDDDVVGLFIQMDGLGGGWATIHELRNELQKVKAAGKKVFVYMVTGTMREYFLASVADKIYVDAAGAVRLQGFSATSIYFKRLFDILGVEAQFEKIEEYKSAPESWTRTGPSEPALEMRNELYDDIYNRMVAEIADGRGISEDDVRRLIDNGPYTAGDLAKQPALVDGVVEPDELDGLLAVEMGQRYPIGSRANERSEKWVFPSIAVIYIGGDIVDGKSRTIPILGRQLVGGQTIAQAIAAARADPRIKAIILRIDSPGGSALASEVMSREVFKTRGKKPIICSMGNVAASGGYFAAAGCDKIFADPMTITGSIGIFNGKFDLSTLLSRMGLSWSTYKRGKRADAESYFRSFTDEERAVMKRMLHYFYGRFIKAVADGRGLTTEQVDSVGRGRVWTGAQAKPLKLVDEMGGIGEAIDAAKTAAGMPLAEKAQLVFLPKAETNLLEKLIGGGVPGLSDKAGDSGFKLEDLIPGGAAMNIAELFPASLWADPTAIQARLPFAIVWE